MIVIERTVDLSRPITTETLRGSEFKLESNAHTFKIHVTQNGEGFPLTGSVEASMLLANNNGLTIEGSIDDSDGSALLTLPQAAYGVSGRFLLAIYSIQTGETDTDTVKTCIYACVGSVVNTYGSPQYDPGNVIPDAETLAAYIDALQGAIADIPTAVLYTSQTLESNQQEQARANISAEVDGIVDQWLEETTNYTNVTSERTTTNKKVINQNRNVANTDSSGYYVTDKFTVTPGDVYRCSWKMNYGNYLYVFYNSSDTAFGGSRSGTGGSWTTLTNQLVTIPSNAVAMRIGFYSTFTLEKQSTETEFVADRVSNYPSNAWYTDRLNGKRWVVIGDSITENNSTASAKYHKLIADATGITVINKGKSGTGYGKTYSTSENFCDRVLTLSSTECDIITIFGSFNDLSLDLGTASDAVSAGTIGGYMNGTLDNLFATKPNVSVGIILPTPWWGKTPTGGTTNSDKAIAYCEMLTTIAQKRSIPVLDLFHRSNLHPDDADFRTAFFDNADGTHPNNEGHKKFAPAVQQFLQELVW